MNIPKAFPFFRITLLCGSLFAGALAEEPAAVELAPEPTQLKVTANSAGPVKLGMSIANARAAMDGAKFDRASDGEGVALISVTREDKEVLLLSADEQDSASPVDEAAHISFIEVVSSEYETETGVRVGMDLADAEKLYGAAKELVMSELEAREYVTFEKQPSGLHFRLVNGSGSAGIYKAGEMVTTDYRPGSKISKIEVSGADIMQDGGIGGINLDATEMELMAIAEKEGLGALEKGKDEIWEAFGEAVQPWFFKDSGLSVDMISGEIGGPKTVFSITVVAPSRLKTEHGIGIGTSKEEVIKAYSEYRTERLEGEHIAAGGDKHLVGSIYGGMIFDFEDGKVARIFLGAAAE